MILVLTNGDRVDTNDPDALEKATVINEWESLEKAVLTPEKARKILHDKEVHGKPLTDQQRKYFGAVAGGTAKKGNPDGNDKPVSDDKPGESLEETSTKELTTTLDDIKARLKKKPGDAALVARQKAISGALAKRKTPDTAAKSLDSADEAPKPLDSSDSAREPMSGVSAIEALGEFAKAVYIGPRGGRWADPKHTIPFKAEAGKAPGKKPGVEKPAEVGSVALTDDPKMNEMIGKRVAIQERMNYLDAPAAKDELAAERKRLETFDKKHPEVLAAIRAHGAKKEKEAKTAEKEVAAGRKKDIFEGLGTKKSMSGVQILEEFVMSKAETNEQETDMTNELLKSLDPADAEMVKGMYGPAGSGRVLEWADQFYSDTGMEKQALQCVKDMIACKKKWDAHREAGKTWREIEDMPRKAREAYRAKRSKERAVIDKEEDAIRMKMRDLEEKLVDHRMKEVSVRQSMGKGGGIEALSDFAKGDDAGPASDPAAESEEPMSGAEILGNHLEKSRPALAVTPAPVQAPEPYVESQSTRPPDRMTTKDLSVPGHQREMVAHANAQVVSRLRKGPADIHVRPGGPARKVAPEPVRKARQVFRHDDTLEICDSGADAAAARMAKGEDYWEGGHAPGIGKNPMALTQRKRCPSCNSSMAKSLAVCSNCGDGAGALVMPNPEQNLRKSGPVLRPARGEADIFIE